MSVLLQLAQEWWAITRSNPVALLIQLAIPLFLVARWRRVYPGPTLVALAAVPCVLAIAYALDQRLLSLVLAVDVAVILIAAADLWGIPAWHNFHIERECQTVASLRHNHRVELSIENRRNRAEMVWIRDGVPPEMNATPDEFRLALAPRSRSTVHYHVQAMRRGAFVFDAVYLKLRSRLGLWRRYTKHPLTSTVKVYPDLKQLSEYALLARTNRLNLMGVRRTRRIGQDNEFERLRDYTLDDNYKHIDWRSTARRNKLTVKDFQTNQSQRVIFMLDCGRMMTNESSGISLLDHALNSILMLSYVALNRGDSVGLVTFSDAVHSSVPARSGSGQMNHLLHATYDRFPRLVESRYEEAFLHVSSRFRKRSLIVLLTNIIDEVNSWQIHQYLTRFAGRHLPMAVVLRDRSLYSAVDATRLVGSQLYYAAAAAQIITWRQQVLRDLRHHGVLVLDSFPETMTAPLINQYLEVKARHLL